MRTSYTSEAATNDRNRGIACSTAIGKIYSDPDEATDVYTRLDAPERHGHRPRGDGRHPCRWRCQSITGEQVIDAGRCRQVLAIPGDRRPLRAIGRLATRSDFRARAAISGGLVTVAPGKGSGLSTCSPRLDSAGNSVKGQFITRFLSRSARPQPLCLPPCPVIDAGRCGELHFAGMCPAMTCPPEVPRRHDRRRPLAHRA